MARKIRLTEGDLHKIVKRVINEAFKSNTLRDLNDKTPSEYHFHGGKDLDHKMNMDYDMNGMPVGREGLGTSAFLDKITDDMIETIVDRKKLSKIGYYVDKNGRLHDADGNIRHAMVLRNGKLVIFKNNPETVSMLKQLSKEAGEKYQQREKYKRNDGKERYQWSDRDRGRAFRDWRDTGIKYWDAQNMFQPSGDYPGWRKDSWVQQNMDKALGRNK